MTEPEWHRANRANWDERVGVHIGPSGRDLSDLRAGRGKLNAIEEAELPPVEGKRIAHLQCHFGADSLTLAQRDAEVVGLDFSAAAIEVARKLAGELGLASRARFVHADLYAALAAIPPPHRFDIVFVTWGRSAGCPTSPDGRGLSRRCCVRADRSISPRAIPPPTSSMTPRALRTACRACSPRISRMSRWSTRRDLTTWTPTLGSPTRLSTTGSILWATSSPASPPRA